MPQYNTWAPRTGAFVGKQLTVYQHKKPKHQQEGFLSPRQDKGFHDAFSALNALGTRRVGGWINERYPSAYIPVRRRFKRIPRTNTMVKKKKKQYKYKCCRVIKGKKVCKPKYCREKNKKYWY